MKISMIVYKTKVSKLSGTSFSGGIKKISRK